MGCTGWSAHRRAALFQARRTPDARRPIDVAQHRRPAGACPTCRTSIRSARRSSAPATISAIPTNADFNGATQDGVGYHQTTTRNGKRCSTAVGYLHPVTRPAQPARHHRRAGGTDPVRRQARGRRRVPRRTAAAAPSRARREVILCGGAINSPQLLLLSGVGPQEQLAASRHPGGAPSAGRRPGDAGPLLGADQAEMPLPDHRQRRDAEPAEKAAAPAWNTTCCRRGPMAAISAQVGAVRAHARRNLRRPT